ncbi:MAG: hypothetical protein JO202_11880 [Ktedonobacteraceae bacterium]|nr:hypothetical protein [Ktedonobacteraceae bacterium]
MNISLALPATSLAGITGTFDSIQLNAHMALHDLQMSTEKSTIVFAAKLQVEEAVIPVEGKAVIKPQVGVEDVSIAIALDLASPLPVGVDVIFAPSLANGMLLVDVLALTFSSPSLSATRLPGTLQKQIATLINTAINKALEGKVRFTQLKIDADVCLGGVLNGNMPLTLIIKGVV